MNKSENLIRLERKNHVTAHAYLYSAVCGSMFNEYALRLMLANKNDPKDLHNLYVRIGEYSRDNKMGFHAFTSEQRAEVGRKVAEMHRRNGTNLYGISTEERRRIGLEAVENKTGIWSDDYTDEMRAAASRRGHATSKEKGIGVFGIPPEKRKELGEQARDLKLGIFSDKFTPEMRAQAGRKGCETMIKNRIGIFALSSSERSAMSINNCKTANYGPDYDYIIEKDKFFHLWQDTPRNWNRGKSNAVQIKSIFIKAGTRIPEIKKTLIEEFDLSRDINLTNLQNIMRGKNFHTHNITCTFCIYP